MMSQPEGSVCQSCGMPLSRDERGGGTEVDGRKSTEYCSHCYQHGAFTLPDLTVDQMVERAKGKMIEMHVPESMAAGMASQIPNLKRWSAAR